MSKYYQVELEVKRCLACHLRGNSMDGAQCMHPDRYSSSDPYGGRIETRVEDGWFPESCPLKDKTTNDNT